MPQDDTSSKLDVYNLGENGVNLTKSPIHIADGELVAAQNAEFYLDEGLGAIRKRPGLQRLNSSSLAGAVRGVIGVPLPGPGRRTIYSQRPNSPFWRKSVDGGATFADTTGELPTAPGSGGVSHSSYPMNLTRNVAHQFFWTAVDGSSNALLLGFDGIAQYEVLRFAGGTARVLAIHDGDLVITERTDAQRVWIVDPVTGDMTQLGADFASGAPGEEPFSACSYQGKVWVGTANSSQAKLYSARPGDTTWTLERTAAANLWAYMSLAVYNGKLYAALAAKVGTAALIEQRDAAGTWTTSDTGSTAAEANMYDGLAVCDSLLFAGYHTNASGTVCTIRQFNGAWSLSKNLALDSVLG